MPSSRSVAEVFGAAVRLGLTSFGGPIAHIGYFRREYVDRRHWLEDAAFADLVALCHFLPGPASSQLGIAIGTRRTGMAGGLAAWLGFTLPSAIALLAFGMLTMSIDLSRSGWIHGLKLAAVAVVAQAVYLMARRLTPDWPRRLVALVAAAIALVWVSPLAQVAVIAGGAVVGWLVLRGPSDPPTQPEPSPIPRRVGAVALIAFVALLIGLPIARAFDGQPLALFESYYRAGSLVFGGGHVVLPLLHSSVVGPGWVTNDQFLAGYGAAQAVPGPLFTVAAYLGAVAAPAPNGLVGGTIALLAIFLPSFLLIFGTLPFWDWLRASGVFRQALGGINAAVVGLLLAALYTPIWTGAVTQPVDVAIVGAALAVLLTDRVPPIAVVVAAALIGQAVGVRPG